MSPWYRIRLSNEQIGRRGIETIQSRFNERWAARGSPDDAALLCRAIPGEQCDLFLSPSAARIVEDVLKPHGAKACNAPQRHGTVLLGGHVDALDALLAPESQ
jgi:hypothetical protein